VLPAKLRFVAALALDYRGKLEIEIGGSRSLNPADLPRLEKVVRGRLSRSALKRSDRDFLKLRLATLDPVSARVLLSNAGGLGVGSVAAVSATAAAAGSWPAVASAAGHLPLGPVAALENGRVAVAQPFYFHKEPL
jgi:hypothetical protein